jgi:MYXO-CTERM domain-containing protein
VNALDKAIPVSLRSQPSNFFSFPPDLFALRAAVPSEERFRESPGDKDPSEGKLIGSFLGSCSTPGECNWDAAYVGKCEVGTTTKLWIQGSSACNSTQLRVCAGIHGCFPPSSGQSLPPGFPLQFPYSKHILDKTGACQSSPLEFHCPTMLPIGGYYSVMTRSSMIGSAPPTVLKGNDGIPYQATEKQVFTFPEGAFYGNLFAPNGLTGTCAVSGDSPHQLSCVNISDSCPPPPPAGYSSDEPCLPYKNVYACYSLAQQEDLQGGNPDGVAYLNDRICNQPNGNKRCFFQKPERCHYNNPTRNQQEGAHCEWSPTDGVFQDCRGGGRKYPPITTYLNDPCDLIGDTSLCTRIRESISAESNSTYMNTLAAVHDPHDDGGCSTGGGGAAQPASLAALLGLLLHRRRRPRAGQR